MEVRVESNREPYPSESKPLPVGALVGALVVVGSADGAVVGSAVAAGWVGWVGVLVVHMPHSAQSRSACVSDAQ